MAGKAHPAAYCCCEAGFAFYGELWANYRDREWRDFPVIDKTVMMEHFDRLNTAGVSREAALEAAAIAERTRNFKPTVGGTTVGLSSGTSGSRGLFLVNPREQAAWTGTVLAKLLPRALWRKERLAFFSARQQQFVRVCTERASSI